MPPARAFPRFLAPRLRDALSDTPVVLIHGPRQSGKTTLAKSVGARRQYEYFTFDDDVIRGAAESDPLGFVANLSSRVILDEVQRVPGLFAALKAVVDRRRTPGRFILTGSGNVLLIPKLADSLAGRLGVLRLHPLAQCELGRKTPHFLDALFAGSFTMRSSERLGASLADRIVAGGYPAAIARRTHARRAAWYRDYVETLVQRDVRDLAQIRSLESIPRLLSAAASHTAQLLNITDLAGPFQLTRQTIHDYVTLLERVFLVDRLPSWHTNRLNRLVKSPKLHIGDTGLACALLEMDATALLSDRNTLGPMFETFVYQELKRQASWRETPISFYHFRDRDGVEVDIVLEQGARKVAGIEVKSAATVTTSDFRGLHKLREASSSRWAGGAVIYDGEITASFGNGMFAIPVRRLWEPRE
jgi:predicted AAA+ superfamily ATPase